MLKFFKSRPENKQKPKSMIRLERKEKEMPKPKVKKGKNILNYKQVFKKRI